MIEVEFLAATTPEAFPRPATLSLALFLGNIRLVVSKGLEVVDGSLFDYLGFIERGPRRQVGGLLCDGYMLPDRRFPSELAMCRLDGERNYCNSADEAAWAGPVFTIAGETNRFEGIFVVVEDQARADVRFGKADLHGNDVVARGECVTLRLTSAGCDR